MGVRVGPRPRRRAKASLPTRTVQAPGAGKARNRGRDAVVELPWLAMCANVATNAGGS